MELKELKQALKTMRDICRDEMCDMCPVSVNGTCPFTDYNGQALLPYVWPLDWKEEDE